jgi:hypothetical protein
VGTDGEKALAVAAPSKTRERRSILEQALEDKEDLESASAAFVDRVFFSR